MTHSTVEVFDNVAVVTLSRSPVNALSGAVRAALLDTIDSVAADKTIEAIVLIGEGATFSGGADIKKLGIPDMHGHPNLTSLMNIIEYGKEFEIPPMHE